MDISEILKKNESSTLEFKENLNDAVFKSLSAFANSSGGVLLVGVSDLKKIVGIDCSGPYIENLTNRIVNKLGVHPGIDCFEYNGKNVLAITVDKEIIPISYEGRYYKRVGNTTREMRAEELRTHFNKAVNWDGITGNFTIDEIDEESVRGFLQLAKKAGRLSVINETDDIITILKKLKLIVYEKLTNAAVILFGKEPQKFFTNAVIRIGRLKNEVTIVNDHLIGGNLFLQAVEAENAIKNFLEVKYEINEDKFVRENIWEYPLKAFREALFNALIHRDYFKFNIQTQIKFFDDYTWFFNTGCLPEGMTIEQLKKPHPSIARNPILVHIFYLAGFIEEYGSGIGRIMESFASLGLPEPEFKEEFGGFSVYFYKDIFSERKLDELGLNQRQIKAILFIKKKGKITNKEYRDITEISDESARNDLTHLIEMKILKVVGKGRNTHYVFS